MIDRKVHLDERWTLSCRRGEWLLVSVTGDPLAEQVLAAPLIASPAADTERLGEASLRELAGERSSRSIGLGDLVDADAPPEQQLRDLSVIDGRFSPLEHWKAVRIDLNKTRPSVSVWVNLKAASYTSNDRYVSGDDRKQRVFGLVWTLALDDGIDQHRGGDSPRAPRRSGSHADRLTITFSDVSWME